LVFAKKRLAIAFPRKVWYEIGDRAIDKRIERNPYKPPMSPNTSKKL
jgi:hypothetical protein